MNEWWPWIWKWTHTNPWRNGNTVWTNSSLFFSIQWQSGMAESYPQNLLTRNALSSQPLKVLPVGWSDENCGLPHQSSTQWSYPWWDSISEMASKTTSSLPSMSSEIFWLHRLWHPCSRRAPKAKQQSRYPIHNWLFYGIHQHRQNVVHLRFRAKSLCQLLWPLLLRNTVPEIIRLWRATCRSLQLLHTFPISWTSRASVNLRWNHRSTWSRTSPHITCLQDLQWLPTWQWSTFL